MGRCIRRAISVELHPHFEPWLSESKPVVKVMFTSTRRMLDEISEISFLVNRG